MASIIVMIATLVSVGALIGSIIVVVKTPSSRSVARAQQRALQSAADAERAAERVLVSLGAIGASQNGQYSAEAWRGRVASPIFAVFSDAVFVEERDADKVVAAVRSERILAAIRDAENELRFSYSPSWTRVVDRKQVGLAAVPWWSVPPRAVREHGADDAWDNTGAVAQLA